MKARTSDFIDFSKRLFFISTRWLARLKNRGTFRAQRERGFEVRAIGSSHPCSTQEKSSPSWEIFDTLGLLSTRATFPACADPTGRPPDCSCPAAAAESGTTTLYVVLWEYWKLSIAPNREISAWLVHAFAPTLVKVSLQGRWVARPVGPDRIGHSPESFVDRRSGPVAPRTLWENAGPGKCQNAPQWEAWGNTTGHPASYLERDDLG